jgi:hypothetical protein
VKGKRLAINVAVSTVIALAALPSAGASAQTCQGQPDVAALDQYCASLPSSSGAAQPVGANGRSAPALRTALPPADVSQLRNAGTAGQALLSVPAGAPMSRAGAERSASARTLRATTKAARPSGGDGTLIARTLVSAAPDALGGAFQWGITITTLGIAAMAWMRYRGRTKL